MRSGQGGSVSGMLIAAQKLRQMTAMAMVIRILALFIKFYRDGEISGE
jgi:hypothetical protein